MLVMWPVNLSLYILFVLYNRLLFYSTTGHRTIVEFLFIQTAAALYFETVFNVMNIIFSEEEEEPVAAPKKVQYADETFLISAVFYF